CRRPASRPHFHTRSLRDALPIFVSITMHKLYHHVRHHSAEARDARREQSPDEWPNFITREPTPDEAAALADQLETVFAQLNCFEDRKSTRLNSSHVKITYAVFCL